LRNPGVCVKGRIRHAPITLHGWHRVPMNTEGQSQAKSNKAFLGRRPGAVIMGTRTVAILVFDDVEVLDFCGPFEVFSVANRFTDPLAFNVLTVAEGAGPVLTRGGLSVNPHHRLPDCPPPDVLLVPGGQGTRKEMNNPPLIDWIKARSREAELVLSVCTGALLLAKAGLLNGLQATTHHGAIDLLRQTAPKTAVHADRRFVDNGRVVCSAGIAAGIDMSLHVVARLLGREGAEKTARQMDYPWRPTV
jgi:transcriptional regulator GlxA family with amidase domain